MIHPSLEKFPQNTISFLKKLKKNNSREWFEKHRDEFNRDFMEPAEALVLTFGDKLSDIRPDIIAIPKTDKSIFRIHRDVRFSKNKEPYKTNMGLLFWEGDKKKMECPGYYFHIEPDMCFLGVGHYEFPKELLLKFRQVVLQPEAGKKLLTIMKKIQKQPGYHIGGKTLKKTPKGFDPSNPNAELLLYTGLYAGFESAEFVTLSAGELIDQSMKVFKFLTPLHNWFIEYL